MCDDYGDYVELDDEDYDDNSHQKTATWANGFDAGYETAKKDLVDSLSAKKWCSSHNNDSVRAFRFLYVFTYCKSLAGFLTAKKH